VAFQILMWWPIGRWIRIANRLCYPSRAGTYSPKNTKLFYVVLARPRIHRDFDVAIVKLRRGWMVFPPDKLPRLNTLFVVGRKKKNPGKKCNRRDWGELSLFRLGLASGVSRSRVHVTVNFARWVTGVNRFADAFAERLLAGPFTDDTLLPMIVLNWPAERS
jgi:hypothetical protein